MNSCEVVVCGPRGSGKTTFLAALAACSQIQNQPINSSLKSFTLEAQDDDTRKNLTNLINCIQKNGKAPATNELFVFDLMFKCSSGQKRLQWTDIIGEYHTPERPSFNTVLDNAQGYAVFIDGNELVTKLVSSFLHQKDAQELLSHELFAPVVTITEKIYYFQKRTSNEEKEKRKKNNIKKKTLIVVITKVDLVSKIKFEKEDRLIAGREILDGILKPLISFINSKNVDFRIIHSATEVNKKEGEELYSITNHKVLAFLKWLTKIDITAKKRPLLDWSFLLSKGMYAPLGALLLASLVTVTFGLWAWSSKDSSLKEPPTKIDSMR